ncbi:hypothetical protein [Anaerofustis stercorihominis]|uniref:hypothetical protein n=1 Tax=Anaerofustis stercorihominis TaxID=214853 RepID=UPI00214B1385|nr:hypothetical protein [Anaerofustis stercorihominis]MCR2032047.1 hypothetical protein [Anaerofustis stercorihominis]
MINLKEIKSRAAELLKKNFWRLLGCVLLVSLVSMAISYIGTNIFSEAPLVQILVYLINLYVSTALGIGLYKILFKIDEERDFSITDLFSFLPSIKECLLVYLLQLLLVIIIMAISFFLGMIFFTSDFVNIYNSYPFISNNMMVNIVLSILPKILLFILVIAGVSLVCDIFPALSMGIVAKEDEALKKNLFSNTFSIGFKNIKNYVLLNLWFLLLIIIACIPFFIVLFVGVGSESGFGVILVLLVTILWIICIIVLSLYFSLAVAILFNRILNSNNNDYKDVNDNLIEPKSYYDNDINENL